MYHFDFAVIQNYLVKSMITGGGRLLTSIFREFDMKKILVELALCAIGVGTASAADKVFEGYRFSDVENLKSGGFMASYATRGMTWAASYTPGRNSPMTLYAPAGHGNRIWQIESATKKHPLYNAKTEKLNPPLRSVLSLREYDCVEKRMRVLQMTFFSKRMAEGSNHGETRPTDGWVYLVPGTNGWGDAAIACTILGYDFR